MFTIRFVAISALLVAVFLASSIVERGAAQTQRVTGEVLKENNEPIQSVQITIHRDGDTIGRGSSNQDGSYAINFDAGQPVSTVWYILTGYHDGMIEHLSGERDHTINKTLYPDTDNLGLFEAQEVLAAYERVYFIVEKEGFENKRDRYLTILGTMRERDLVPSEMNERLSSVIQLWSNER